MRKKKNIKIVIAYDGGRYNGWQRLGMESGCLSVQQVLEKALSSLCREAITIIGSGRTDAGVHAIAQTANFHTSFNGSLRQLKIDLNRILPEDIVVKKLENAPDTFHSRFDAKDKTYAYCLDTGERQGVFARKYTLWCEEALDVERMKEASSYLLGTHDFKAFASKMPDGRDTIRTIKEIRIEREKRYIIIKITADGFLYNMVRIISGTLLEAGKKKIFPKEVKSILESGKRSNAGPTLSPNALFLVHVNY